MQHSRWRLALVASLMTTTFCASAAAAEQPPSPGLDKIAASHPTIDLRVQGQSVTVRASKGITPEMTAAVFEMSEAAPNITFTYTGLTVPTGAERRAGDAQLAGLALTTKAAISTCDGIPTGLRDGSGSARATVSCLAGQSAQATLAAKKTQLVSTEAAVIAVAGAFMPGTDLSGTRIVRQGAYARVDLPTAFATAARKLAEADAVALSASLLATVYTDATIGSLQFTVEGDCLAYAYSVAGDACSTISMTSFPK